MVNNQFKLDFSFFMPTKIFFGKNKFTNINNLDRISSSNKVLAVSGDHFKNSKDFKDLVSFLGKKCLVYEEKIAKSNFETVDKLCDFCRSEKPDSIIAIGGGAVMDSAKSASILINNKGNVQDYVVGKKKVKNKGIFFIAIPTTSGTGSEVTPWATIWDDKNKKKYSLASPLMFPKIAIVDPCLSFSMPSFIAASSGIDSLAQAIEAYWSKFSNPISDALALMAIELIFDNLEKSINNNDKKAKEKVTLASLISGVSFSNTKTTICHSISYPISAYFDVPHGQAVAITLPKMIEYSFPELTPEKRKKIYLIANAKNERDLATKVEKLMGRIGLKTKLKELGIKREDIDLIVEEGFNKDRAFNAPKVPSSKELIKILETIL